MTTEHLSSSPSPSETPAQSDRQPSDEALSQLLLTYGLDEAAIETQAKSAKPRRTSKTNHIATLRKADDPLYAVDRKVATQNPSAPETDPLESVVLSTDPTDPINAYIERLASPNAISVDTSEQLAKLREEAVALQKFEELNDEARTHQTAEEIQSDTFKGRQIEYVTKPTLRTENINDLWSRPRDEYSADAAWSTVPLFGSDQASYKGTLAIDFDNNPIRNDLTPEETALERYFAAHPQIVDGTPVAEAAILGSHDADGNYTEARRQSSREPRVNRERSATSPERKKAFTSLMKRVGSTALANFMVIREKSLSAYSSDREKLTKGFESLQRSVTHRYKQTVEQLRNNKQHAAELVKQLSERAKAARIRQEARLLPHSLAAQEKAKLIRERFKGRLVRARGTN